MAEKKVFLLVDDDADDREVFEDVLLQVDASVGLQTATNGSEAMAMLAGAQAPLPQLIFLDLNMPRMDGKECLRQLKRHEVLKNIPVVMYTTSALATDVAETLEAGAAGYIAKPTTVQALKQILTAIVESPPAQLQEAVRRVGLPNRHD